MTRRQLTFAGAAVAAAALALTVVVARPHRNTVEPERSGSSTDVVRLQVGDRLMLVPPANLGMPVNAAAGTQSDKSLVVLVGAAPTFEGRGPSTEEAFSAPGSDPLIWVKVHRVSGRSPQAALAGIREIHLAGDLVSSGADGSELHQVRRTQRPGLYNSTTGDLFLAGDGAFTVCSRSEGVVRSPSCETAFALDKNVIVIRFGRRWMQDRHVIRSTVEAKIRAWTITEEP